jgi:hypothetical protein
MAAFGKNPLHKMLLLHQIFLQFSGTGLIIFGRKYIHPQGILTAITRLQIVNQVFPKEQLSLILSLTNEKISVVRGKKLTEGESIKFFGI